MAKLYAELTSDKGGRVVGKGGHDYVNVDIKCGNHIIARIEYNLPNNQLHINDETEDNELIVNVDGYLIS